jgi:hypothetical protein
MQEHRHGSSAPGAMLMNFLGLINTSRRSLVRNNERYLAFSPAVAQAFLEDTKKPTFWPDMIFPRGIS